MALTKVNTQFDNIAPQSSKLKNFATALGILNTVAGLGAQAASSFSSIPQGTGQLMAAGPQLEGVPNPSSLPAPSAASIDLYKNPVFLNGNDLAAASLQAPNIPSRFNLIDPKQMLLQKITPEMVAKYSQGFSPKFSGLNKLADPGAFAWGNYENAYHYGGEASGGGGR